MRWVDALKVWNGQNPDGHWCVPKKGTADYDKVKAIMAKSAPGEIASGKKVLKASDSGAIQANRDKVLGEWAKGIQAKGDDMRAKYAEWKAKKAEPAPAPAPAPKPSTPMTKGITLEELYELANTSSPGGNHYTVDETNRVWNKVWGKKLLSVSSAEDQKGFRAYFLAKKVYYLMAQRYSGVVDNHPYADDKKNPDEEESRIVKMFDSFNLPGGYKIYHQGCAVMLRKESEPLENMGSLGSEEYNSLPDEVRRPYGNALGFETPADVKETLKGSLDDFKALVKSRKAQRIAEKKAKEDAARAAKELENKQIDWIAKNGSRDDVFNWVSSETNEDEGERRPRGNATMKTLIAMAKERGLRPKEFRRYGNAEGMPGL